MTVDEDDEEDWLTERKMAAATQSDRQQNDIAIVSSKDMWQLGPSPPQRRGWVAGGGGGI